MARKAGKATAAAKKKAGKKSAVRKRAAAKKSAPAKKAKRAAKKVVAAPAALTPAPPPAALRRPAALVDPKNGAINACVNSLMDTARPGWSDNGKMDADYKYNNHSMRAFLSTVKSCLQGKHFSLNMNDDDFVTACVSAAVYQLKQLIYDKTT
jgi:hypothetical protein